MGFTSNYYLVFFIIFYSANIVPIAKATKVEV